MKAVIMGIALMLMTQLSQANYECHQYEAQVLGRIQRIEYHRRAENLDCRVYLGFNLLRGDIFNMSQVCPLTIDEAMRYPIFVQNCHKEDFQSDQVITGVLVRKASEQELTLE